MQKAVEEGDEAGYERDRGGVGGRDQAEQGDQKGRYEGT